MMRNVLPLTVLALGLSSGVALADRHGDHRGVIVEHRGAPHATSVVRDHRWNNGAIVVRDHGGWRGDGWHGGGQVIVHSGPGYRPIVRRPIYVSRPIIRERYFNYYRRPTLIVENYNTMPGYYWVAGSWAWNGGEWIWQPGHYEPDPSYIDQGYDQGYDQSYDQGYDQGY